MKRYYCTYFDRNYLYKALALYQSLCAQSSGEFHLYVICLDEISRLILEKFQLKNVSLIPLHWIEKGDAALGEAKQNRSLVEYYWTITPTIILRILEWNPQIDVLTYLDADLFFFSSPEPIFAEFGSNAVLIHEHRFPARLEDRSECSGRFNVGLMCVRGNEPGLKILRWWRERCNEWCYAKPEGGQVWRSSLLK